MGLFQVRFRIFGEAPFCMLADFAAAVLAVCGVGTVTVSFSVTEFSLSLEQRAHEEAPGDFPFFFRNENERPARGDRVFAGGADPFSVWK
jgi:hypothetical protein